MSDVPEIVKSDTRERLEQIRRYVEQSNRMMETLLKKVSFASVPERAQSLMREIQILQQERTLALRDLEHVLMSKGMI